jgi:creatinine amidohydrolase
MTVCWLATATYEEVAALDRARTVAIVPLGATEAHGPHLPLSTDVIIVEAMVRAGAERLAKRGVPVAVLPTVALTPVPFAAAFPGTLGVRAATLVALLEDLADGLASQGFSRMALASAHLDPAHLAAVYEAIETIRGDGMRVAFPDLTRKPWALRLGDEFLSGACHAGRFESSIVLAEHPELVREVRTRLAPNPSSLSEAIRAGRATFAEAGGPRAYFGWPADATAEEGRALVDTLGAILDEAIQPLFADDGE